MCPNLCFLKNDSGGVSYPGWKHTIPNSLPSPAASTEASSTGNTSSCHASHSSSQSGADRMIELHPFSPFSNMATTAVQKSANKLERYIAELSSYRIGAELTPSSSRATPLTSADAVKGHMPRPTKVRVTQLFMRMRTAASSVALLLPRDRPEGVARSGADWSERSPLTPERVATKAGNGEVEPKVPHWMISPLMVVAPANASSSISDNLTASL
mmetsp:Transcript_70904/g.133530  ORF Transcript_70904/g.133530 Transcript_70904/m.133530 type:complete len:214 (+) Transcript_70904:146-787(+)